MLKLLSNNRRKWRVKYSGCHFVASYIYPSILGYAKELNKEVQEIDTLGSWTPYPVRVLLLQWVSKKEMADRPSNKASTKVSPPHSP